MSLQYYAQQSLHLIDLTSLNDNDNETSIIELCHSAHTKFGNVAAICIYKQFISTAQKYFREHNINNIKIATVTNFPHGKEELISALKETQYAIENGADEVDIVFPYQALKAGNYSIGAQMVAQAKQICATKTLKVIIESGELKTPELINLASEIAIASGADFIKTSTGKVTINATIATAAIMLQAIKRSGSACGFKAAGGIRRVQEAQQYLNLAVQIMGVPWLNSHNFRFGASGLLNDVLSVLAGTENNIHNTYSY